MLWHRRWERGGRQPGSGHLQPAAGPRRSLRHRLFTAGTATGTGTGSGPAIPAPTSVLGSRHRDRPASAGTVTGTDTGTVTCAGTGTGSSSPAQAPVPPGTGTDPHIILPRLWTHSDSPALLFLLHHRARPALPGSPGPSACRRYRRCGAPGRVAGPDNPGFPSRVGGGRDWGSLKHPQGSEDGCRREHSRDHPAPGAQSRGHPWGPSHGGMRGPTGARRGRGGSRRGGGDSSACGKVRALKVNLGRF